jgi:hypothetical protein
LERPFVTEVRIHAVAPGEEWVLMSASMHNVGPSPIQLVSVSIEGSGIGTVVRVERTEVAPIDASPETTDTTPGGVYKTYPPAFKGPGERHCRVQVLAPVRGYVLDPGSRARILVLMHAEEFGKFRITSHTVEYREGESLRSQSLPIGLSGEVTADGEPMKQLRRERLCDSLTRVLPSAD